MSVGWGKSGSWTQGDDHCIVLKDLTVTVGKVQCVVGAAMKSAL